MAHLQPQQLSTQFLLPQASYVWVSFIQKQLLKKKQCMIEKHVSNSREFKWPRGAKLTRWVWGFSGSCHPPLAAVNKFHQNLRFRQPKETNIWNNSFLYELKKWATVALQQDCDTLWRFGIADASDSYLNLKLWEYCKYDHIIVSTLNHISTHQLICQPFPHPWRSSDRSRRPGSRPSSWPSW